MTTIDFTDNARQDLADIHTFQTFVQKIPVEIADNIKNGVDAEEQIEILTDLCNTMKFGSLCALGGFTPYPVMSALTHFPEDFFPEQQVQAAE